MQKLKIIALFIILTKFSLVTKLLAQDISSDFFPYDFLQISHDFGHSWQTNTSLKPFQWADIIESISNDSSQFPIHWMTDNLKSSGIQKIIISESAEDKLQCNTWLGSLLKYSDGKVEEFQDGSATLYGYFHFNYMNKFKAWLYPRITTEQFSLDHYTGKPRPNRRAGFNTGETDMAGVGYFDKWIQVWFGRGRQNWGAMATDNLVLSEKSAAYDHGTLQINFQNIQMRYFYGYLETIENNNHRYITGRSIEYNNNVNLIISAQEVVLYSGINRPFDLAYLNPIVTHLEVELNHRTNRAGDFSGQNAIWQLSLDWMPIKGLRFSTNFLADEIVIDDYQREEGKPHGLAYQGRLAWSNTFRKYAYSLFTEYTKIGTYTLRHRKGENNFVSRGLPLGTDVGSDGDKVQIGVRFITQKRFITTFSIGKKRSGDENLLQNLYEPYDQFLDVSFPSGIINKTTFYCLNAIYYPKSNFRITIQSQIEESNVVDNTNYFLLSFDAYIPKHFNL